VYLTEPTHRAWVRWMTPQKRITYASGLNSEKPAFSVQRTALRVKPAFDLHHSAFQVDGNGGQSAAGSTRCSADITDEPDEEEKAAAEEVIAETAREPERDPASLPLG